MQVLGQVRMPDLVLVLGQIQVLDLGQIQVLVQVQVVVLRQAASSWGTDSEADIVSSVPAAAGQEVLSPSTLRGSLANNGGMMNGLVTIAPILAIPDEHG